MEELEKLKEDYKIFKYATEEEFNSIRTQFEATLKFIQSEKEKTIAMMETFQNLTEFMKDVTERFQNKDIQIEMLNTQIISLENLIKAQNINFKILEMQMDDYLKK